MQFLFTWMLISNNSTPFYYKNNYLNLESQAFEEILAIQFQLCTA